MIKLKKMINTKEKAMLKNQKAITLIALVITIIVLIILSAVSINLTVGNNGVITNAMKAKIVNDFATYQEELKKFIVKQNEPTNGTLKDNAPYGCILGLRSII